MVHVQHGSVTDSTPVLLRAPDYGDSAILYLYHLEHMVSVVTMEEDRRERPMHLSAK